MEATDLQKINHRDQDTKETQAEVKTPPQRLMRTMKNDAEEAIKNQHETMVSIALAEEKKRAALQAQQASLAKKEQETVAPPEKRMSRIIVVVSFLLIIIILSLIYVFILPKIKGIAIPTISLPSFNRPTGLPTPIASSTPKTEPLAPSLVPAQSEKRFNVTKNTPEKILGEISKERGHGTPANSIKNFYLFEESPTGASTISADRFFTITNAQAPEIFIRSLEKPFMVGLFGESNGGATPFLILKVSDRDINLAGILEWEKSLPQFFDSVFGTDIKNGMTGATKFHDVVIANRDARTLETAFGGTITYLYADKNTLLITSSATSLDTLISLAVKN